jgi:hypothetical protein
LEKGEVLILAIQFGALIVAVLLLSNFAYGSNASSTPSITTVYWGSPPPGTGVSIGTGTHTESTNSSVISAFYSLAAGTHIVSFSASRLCSNPQSNATSQGDELDYTYIPRYYDTAKGAYYFTFGPTGQPTGWSCVYTITITDSLAQSASWITTIVVEPKAA